MAYEKCSRGKSAYERDVKERPTYDDGTPRKTWEQLDVFAKAAMLEITKKKWHQ